MSIKQMRREYRRVARELGYDRIMPNVFRRIECAQNERELDNIMTTCRKRWN